MLYKYDKSSREISELQATSFTEEHLLERQDIEEWVKQNPKMTGEELFIITSEYDKFDKTNERLDLLALDKAGKLVVIELKRDDSGRNVDLQAIKYAAYVSTMTVDDVVEAHVEYSEKMGKGKTEQQARDEMEAFVDDEKLERLDDKPRIMLISRSYRDEVMASVIWLRSFDIDITCVRLQPYRLGPKGELAISVDRIVPVPEASEYMMKQQKKEASEQKLSKKAKAYQKFWGEVKAEVEGRIPYELGTPTTWNCYQIHTELHKVHFEWLFQKHRGKLFGVELHFERGSREANIKLMKAFVERKEELKTAVGVEMVEVEEWNANWSRICFQTPSPGFTDEIKTFAVEKMVKFIAAAQPILDELKNAGT